MDSIDNPNFLPEIEFASMEEIYEGLTALWLPPPDVTITEWAEDYRVLSAENCALPGDYRVAVTPFLKEIQEACSDSDIPKIVCQKSAQVAWTDGVINNVLGYYIHLDPCPALVLFPTEDMAERYSKEKFGPMIRDSEPLAERIKQQSRNAGNTILSKHYRGGHLELVGSNAPSKLASSPIRLILVEEPDRCSRNSGGEGNSLKLAYERGKTFYNRKIILGGSPTLKGTSEIEREMALSDKRHFFVPCPCCGEFTKLEWHMVVWDKADKEIHEVYEEHLPETAKIECPNCKERFTNNQKNEALQLGEWRATTPFNGVAGFYINELYSPFPNARLQDVVEKFLEAHKLQKSGDHTLMITWKNTSMGETFEIESESVDATGLENRREVYQGEVPHDGIIITCWFDTQGDRLEGEFVAWGPDEETWSLDYIKLYGDLSRPQIWDELEKHMNREFISATGVIHRARLCGIDAGGHYTSEVHKFCRRDIFRYIPTFGSKENGSTKPVASFPQKSNTKHKTYLTELNTVTAKQVIYARIKHQKTGPGYCHYPLKEAYGERYFHGLVIEKMVKKYSKGQEYFTFENQPGGRNEPLDCRVGNFAMIRILQQNFGMQLRSLKKLMDKTMPTIEPSAPQFVQTGIESETPKPAASEPKPVEQQPTQPEPPKRKKRSFGKVGSIKT